MTDSTKIWQYSFTASLTAGTITKFLISPIVVYKTRQCYKTTQRLDPEIQSLKAALKYTQSHAQDAPAYAAAKQLQKWSMRAGMVAVIGWIFSGIALWTGAKASRTMQKDKT